MPFPFQTFMKKVHEPPIPTDGLLAEYLFSNNYLDTSGNGRDGVNNGTTPTTDRKTQANSAIQLVAASSQYVNIDATNIAIKVTTKGTWSAWVKPVTAIGAFQTIMSYGDADQSNVIQFAIDSTGKLRAGFVQGPVQWDILSDNIIFADGVWANVMLVQDGISPKLYFNGILQDAELVTELDTTKWFADIVGWSNGRVGCRNFANLGNISFLDGDEDDIRIYDRDLTQEEITILANE